MGARVACQHAEEHARQLRLAHRRLDHRGQLRRAQSRLRVAAARRGDEQDLMLLGRILAKAMGERQRGQRIVAAVEQHHRRIGGALFPG